MFPQAVVFPSDGTCWCHGVWGTPSVSWWGVIVCTWVVLSPGVTSPCGAQRHTKPHHRGCMGMGVPSLPPDRGPCRATWTLTTQSYCYSPQGRDKVLYKAALLQTSARRWGFPGHPCFQKIGYKSRGSHDTLHWMVHSL